MDKSSNFFGEFRFRTADLKLSPDKIYVFDKGYNDYQVFSWLKIPNLFVFYTVFLRKLNIIKRNNYFFVIV